MRTWNCTSVHREPFRISKKETRLLVTHPDDCDVLEKILKLENNGSLHMMAEIDTSKERLDQGHLYSLGEHPGGQTLSLPIPKFEPGSPASLARAGTCYLASLYADYSVPLRIPI